MDEWLADRLKQIRRAAGNACNFVEGFTREDFDGDLRTQQACALNLIIAGEAAKRVVDRYPDLPSQQPSVEWRLMAAMHNHIAHDYDRVNISIVWETVTQDLPALIMKIDNLLNQ